MCEVKDFDNVILFLLNKNSEQFIKMYAEFGIKSDYFVAEQYQFAASNFMVWWCSMDDEMKKDIIIYVRNFYNKQQH